VVSSRPDREVYLALVGPELDQHLSRSSQVEEGDSGPELSQLDRRHYLRVHLAALRPHRQSHPLVPLQEELEAFSELDLRKQAVLALNQLGALYLAAVALQDKQGLS